ncbi:acyl-CoA dehydrogenase family protein [Phyllobacterium sp. YR531]|uniref:acyl-CoA dehydrogenase family protein n=1 Tax=Phyllobacterium sp. YR531 TaxID=1144343 RepID=UPI00026FBA77|nr:acyl-CoA dehydrogenase family protein [Phyllobacterium sp. YR531]EJN05841.1 acyl-CoA dehydrogenase [Phyllobacterium sp. YR531]
MNGFAVRQAQQAEFESSGSIEGAKLTEQPAFVTLLQAIEDRRGEFDRLRHVPRDVIDMMKAARIFRAATPTQFGGDALAPHHFLKMVEKIGEVDGSAAWVAAFGSANTYIAALPSETQAIIYAKGPDQVYAGGLYPLQPAERVEGGWKVSGRWKFASGCKGADWIGVGMTGKLSPNDTDSGQAPTVKMAVCPADEVEIIETWDVVGMQGTGSHDTQVKDKFFADAWTCDRGSPGIFDAPLYRYPPLAYQAQVHAAVNLGLARAALNVAVDMSGGAKIMPGAPILASRGYFRSGLAEGEARLRSARSFYYEMAEQAWDELQNNASLSLELNNLLRLSASHAAKASAQTVQDCYRIVGMAAIQRTHRMQHILRDALVVTQHAALNDATFENAGAVLAGMPAIAGYP